MDLTGSTRGLGVGSEVCRVRFWASREVGSSQPGPAAALEPLLPSELACLSATTQTK